MYEIDDCFKKISERGDRYGGSGGLLDLLTWCNKMSLLAVTQEEAEFFLEHPDSPYADFAAERPD